MGKSMSKMISTGLEGPSVLVEASLRESGLMEASKVGVEKYNMMVATTKENSPTGKRTDKDLTTLQTRILFGVVHGEMIGSLELDQVEKRFYLNKTKIYNCLN